MILVDSIEDMSTKLNKVVAMLSHGPLRVQSEMNQ